MWSQLPLTTRTACVADKSVLVVVVAGNVVSNHCAVSLRSLVVVFFHTELLKHNNGKKSLTKSAHRVFWMTKEVSLLNGDTFQPTVFLLL